MANKKMTKARGSVSVSLALVVGAVTVYLLTAFCVIQDAYATVERSWTYTIQSDDCWITIAKKTGCNWKALMMNNGANDKTVLRPGKELNLPTEAIWYNVNLAEGVDVHGLILSQHTCESWKDSDLKIINQKEIASGETLNFSDLSSSMRTAFKELITTTGMMLDSSGTEFTNHTAYTFGFSTQVSADSSQIEIVMTIL